ncbi:hypothetical protein HWQ46_25430 [Shewanella sp. D64]|uniref:hypothetical protein n=1 Tax=unclassified Shewanella TaxID=196818 RepID=UPI0022BA5C54|nr:MULTISPECIES: hypothetical protein [unclassified Shewanella]MEC4728861.1 hypothetical protein [Shewanella sp. D64]MEC4740735.1 hypothetical protein [Shewanella sp. E94]WBJ95306.1 hypothetical protein HWQ47_26555 [Shewanella sp. MTB7]
MRIKQQLRNALAIIEQMKNKEWKFITIHMSGDEWPECFVAKRGKDSLWVANGMFFCAISDRPWELGIFRVLVWFFGARQGRRKAIKEGRGQVSNLRE